MKASKALIIWEKVGSLPTYLGDPKTSPFWRYFFYYMIVFIIIQDRSSPELLELSEIYSPFMVHLWFTEVNWGNLHCPKNEVFH